MMTRVCTKCQTAFPATLEHFGKSKLGKYGLSSWCRACAKTYQQERNALMREQRTLTHRNYMRRRLNLGTRPCASCGGEMHIEWNLRRKYCSDRCRLDGLAKYGREYRATTGHDWQLRAAYGITAAQRKAMILAQDNRCAICSNELPKDTRHVHTDHDHVTGKVRGILCAACNILLGRAKDDEAILLAAIRYLRRARSTAKSA